jgi:hypothetical protein
MLANLAFRGAKSAGGRVEIMQMTEIVQFYLCLFFRRVFPGSGRRAAATVP